MALVISVHEYELKPDVDEAAFENAIRDPERRGLFNLPGLTSHYFLRGFKGHRRGTYAALSHWIKELPRDRRIVVYCICGFQVSGTAVTELRRRGYDARALIGGITAWHAIGGMTVPLDTSTYEQST